MRKRVILEGRVLDIEFFGGPIVQIRATYDGEGGTYWHTPDEDMTYGVLDSSWPIVYKTTEEAHTRLQELLS